MRIDKYLTQSHMGTRKKVHTLIADGRIFVNDQTVTDASLDIDTESAQVSCDGALVTYVGTVCYMFHKPKGCVSARSDENQKTVMDYFGDINTEGIFLIGRLDKDTEGLLLLTNDGELDQKLMNPEGHIDKTYYFVASGSLSEEDISNIENGVVIWDGCAPTRNAHLSDVCNYKVDRKIEALGNRVKGYLTISEGKRHQVKRMLRWAGCRVIELKRVSIGGLKLDETLSPGEYRELTKAEIEKLFLKKQL